MSATTQAAVVGATDDWGDDMEAPYTWRCATPDTLPFVVSGSGLEAEVVDMARNGVVTVYFAQALLMGRAHGRPVTGRERRVGTALAHTVHSY